MSNVRVFIPHLCSYMVLEFFGILRKLSFSHKLAIVYPLGKCLVAHQHIDKLSRYHKENWPQRALSIPFTRVLIYIKSFIEHLSRKKIDNVTKQTMNNTSQVAQELHCLLSQCDQNYSTFFIYTDKH